MLSRVHSRKQRVRKSRFAIASVMVRAQVVNRGSVSMPEARRPGGPAVQMAVHRAVRHHRVLLAQDGGRQVGLVRLGRGSGVCS